jgi:hypothetical protein
MRLSVWKGKDKMDSTSYSQTELIARAENIFSRESGEPVKFNGFVTIGGELQIRFKFTNKDTTKNAFASSWKYLEEKIKG